MNFWLNQYSCLYNLQAIKILMNLIGGSQSKEPSRKRRCVECGGHTRKPSVVDDVAVVEIMHPNGQWKVSDSARARLNSHGRSAANPSSINRPMQSDGSISVSLIRPPNGLQSVNRNSDPHGVLGVQRCCFLFITYLISMFFSSNDEFSISIL